MPISSLSEVTNHPPGGSNPNYSTLSLKPDRKRQQSLSTEMLLIILFVTSVFMGFAAFSITPKEKREEMKIKLGEWLEPASVVMEQLPFIPKRETETRDSPPSSGELLLESPVSTNPLAIPLPVDTPGSIPNSDA